MKSIADKAEVVERWFRHPAKGPVKGRYVLRFEESWFRVNQFDRVEPVAEETWPTKEECIKHHLDIFQHDLDKLNERRSILMRQVMRWTRYSKVK